MRFARLVNLHPYSKDSHRRLNLFQQFCHEALVWRQLHHPNILPLLGVNIDAFHPSFCLISPWMNNGDIVTFLKQNPQHNLPWVVCALTLSRTPKNDDHGVP